MEKQSHLTKEKNQKDTGMVNMQVDEDIGGIKLKIGNEREKNQFEKQKLNLTKNAQKSVVDKKVNMNYEDVGLCLDMPVDLEEVVFYKGKQIGKCFREENNLALAKSTCDFCDHANYLTYSNSPRQLKVHYKRNHVNQDLKYQCEVCSKNFETESELDTHKTLHMHKKQDKCESSPLLLGKKQKDNADTVLEHMYDDEATGEIKLPTLNESEQNQVEVSSQQNTKLKCSIKDQTLNESEQNQVEVPSEQNFKLKRNIKDVQNKSSEKKKVKLKKKSKKIVAISKNIDMSHEDVDLCPNVPVDLEKVVLYQGKPIGKCLREEDNPTFAKSTCDFCDYTNNLQFPNSPKQLKVHYGRSHVKRDLNYKCELCGKKFGTQRDLNTHKALHMYKKCEICGIMFNKRRFFMHARRHDPNNDPLRFECNICQQRFTSKNAMKYHVEAIHNSEHRVLLPCTQCDKFLTSKYRLDEHIRNVHADPKEREARKTHVCATCDKAFIDVQQLRSHQRIHDKFMKYVCHICSKAFRWRSGLKLHLQTHTEDREKNYLCTECGKSFPLSISLTRHMRIHTGERPFSCNICGDTFNDSSILRRHMMLKHKKEK